MLWIGKLIQFNLSVQFFPYIAVHREFMITYNNLKRKNEYIPIRFKSYTSALKCEFRQNTILERTHA